MIVMEDGQNGNNNEQHNMDGFASYLRESGGDERFISLVEQTERSLRALHQRQNDLLDSNLVQEGKAAIMNDIARLDNEFRNNLMSTILYISTNPPRRENIFKRFWNWCKGVVNKAKGAWQNHQAKKTVSEKIDVEFENLQETINHNYEMCEAALNSANSNEEVMSAIKDLDERNNNVIKEFQEKSNEIVNDATNISNKAKNDLRQNVNKKSLKIYQETNSFKPLKKVKDAAKKFKPKAREQNEI